MYSNLLEKSLSEREGDKRYELTESQYNMAARKALDPVVTYGTVASQDAYISAIPAQAERSWATPEMLYTGQYPYDFVNGIINSDANMDHLLQQWLHREATDSIPTSSSIDVPAYSVMEGVPMTSAVPTPGYTEALLENTISSVSQSEVLSGTMPGSYLRRYRTTTGSSPDSHQFKDDGISPSQASQSLPTPTSYYVDAPSTTTMGMAYPQVATTFDEYNALMYPMTTTSQMEPLPTLPSTTTHPYHEHYAVLDQELHNRKSYILKTQSDEAYLHSGLEPLDERHIHAHVHDSQKPFEMSIDDLKAVSKQVGTSKRKAKSTSKKAKDCMALMKIPKSESVSRQTSCWRCRRYKKPCNGKGSVCDACVTSGFRIWSSEIGCRKGDMNEFITMLIPSDVERNTITINVPYLKPPSFRQSSRLYPSDMLIPKSAAKGDVWDQFLYKVQSTGIQGPGVLELLGIAIRYQRKLRKPEKVLVGAIRSMSVASDIFRLLVATKDSDTFTSSMDLNKVFVEARKVLAVAAGQFLRNCLTGRIKHWLPTLLASNINVFAYIMIGDAINAIPIQYRAEIWPNIRKTLLDMRQVLYPTARDLLNALSKGSQPLNMSCWDVTQENDGPGSTPRIVRDAEGMRLVDDCEITFDAIRELQGWREQFSYLLKNDNWMNTKPLEVDLLLISSVARLYITPKA